MIGMIRKILLIPLIVFCISRVSAEQSVDDLKNQAFANITRARHIIAYAQKLIETSPSRQAAEHCVQLYLEAAQLYGNAARLLRAMGSNYVPQGIIDEFAKGEKNCLKIVDDIRRFLNRGEIVGTHKDTMQSLLKKLKETSP